jgi:hypothetical protein
MSNWLSGIIGQGIAANLGACGHMAQQNAAQQQAMNMSQGQMAASPNGFGAGGFGAGGFGAYEPVNWMIDGKAMKFEEFVNTIYPEDCAEKTMLILRLKREESK